MIHSQFVFAKNVALLIQFIFSSGYYCTMGEAFRTHEQALIYAAHNQGIVNSLHCNRLAIDLNLFSKDGKYENDYKTYERFGKYWESLDHANRWGGDFKRLRDLDHFEMRPL